MPSPTRHATIPTHYVGPLHAARVAMSYLALARKYRPRRFEDVMGQGHVVKALSHALDHDRLHPAINFATRSGP